MSEIRLLLLFLRLPFQPGVVFFLLRFRRLQMAAVVLAILFCVQHLYFSLKDLLSGRPLLSGSERLGSEPKTSLYISAVLACSFWPIWVQFSYLRQLNSSFIVKSSPLALQRSSFRQSISRDISINKLKGNKCFESLLTVTSVSIHFAVHISNVLPIASSCNRSIITCSTKLWIADWMSKWTLWYKVRQCRPESRQAV